MTDMTAVIAPKSDQINADDLIAGPVTITVSKVAVAAGQEQPVSIHFTGSGKVYRPCKSMSRVLVAAWGADANAYIGRSITLYRDPKVKWGGMEVGGIRISHLTDIDRDMVLMLTATKAKREPHRVKVLEKIAVADETTRNEARAIAAQGTDVFRQWFKSHPAKRPECQAIMPELQKIAADADAALAGDDGGDPFGLPPLTQAQIDAAMQDAEHAARHQDDAQ